MKNYIFGRAIYSNGTTKTSRNFVDSKAFSRWANAQFRKDEEVTVEEYEINRADWAIIKVATWHG